MKLLRMCVAASLAGAIASPALGAQFTVGAGGNQPSLSAAFVASGTSAGDDEIRIASGTRLENVSFGLLPAETVRVSGGWDASFSTQIDDPELTVLDGNAAGHTLYGTMAQGRVEIANLTLRNGRALTGGGIEVDASGSARLLLDRIVVRDSLATWEFASNGGGLKVNARNDAVVEIRDSVFRNNRAESTANSTLGGGAFFNGSENGRILALRSTFSDNFAESPSEPQAGGLYASLFGNSGIELVSCVVRGNRLRGGSVSGGSGAGIVSIHLGTSVSSLRGSVLSDNLDESRSDGGQQLASQLVNSAALDLGDTEISSGGGIGAMIFAYDTSIADLTNLTVVANAGGGLLMNRTASAAHSLFNSIVYGNGGTELQTNLAPQTGANLIEGAAGASAPQFVDASDGNYRLRASSPAIDVGDAAPPASLGSIDADGGPRVVGPAVDLGAYERGSLDIFGDGFET